MTTLRQRAAQLAQEEAERISSQALESSIAQLLEMTAQANKAARQTAENTQQAESFYKMARSIAREHRLQLHLQATLTGVIVSWMLLLVLWFALPSWKRSALKDAWSSSRPTPVAPSPDVNSNTAPPTP